MVPSLMTPNYPYLPMQPHRLSYPLARLWRGLFLGAVASLLCCLAQAQGTDRRNYDIPGDAAARTLKLFSEQSGRTFIADGDLLNGVKTNPVKGALSPQEAVNLMLAGTNLVATADSRTGAFVIKRAPVPKAEAARAETVQPVRAADATPDAEDATRTLSPFEVRADQESGYRASNSVTASRFALSIMDTPMSIAVVTEEFLRDIGARDALDSLSYVSGITQGNSPVRLEGSNSFNIRGVQTGFMLRNGVTSYGINDGYNIERWEVLKGIVGMMYGDRNLGGVVNSVSAQPKSKPAAEVYTRFDDNDSWRVSGRVTGPINKDRTVLFMVNAMKKDEGTFMKDERLAAEGVTASVIYKPFDRTKLFAEYEYYNQHNTLATKLPPLQAAAGPRANNDTNWWERVGFAPVPLDFNYGGKETYLNEVNRVINLSLDQKVLGWLDYRANFIYSKRAQERQNRDAGATFTTVAPGTARNYFDYATGQVKTETAADAPYIISGMNSNLRENRNWNTLLRNDLLANYNFLFGKHRTMVGFEYQQRSGDFKSFDQFAPVSLDGRYAYTAQLKAFAGTNPRPNTDIRTFDPGLPLPSRNEFYASATTDPTNQNGGFFGSTNETQAYYAVHYSQFFNERFTIFAGIRKDKDRNTENFNRRDSVIPRTNGQPRNSPNGAKIYDPGRPTDWRQRNSPQFGIAYRLLKDLSAYASYSDVLVAYNDTGSSAFQERLVRDSSGVWTVGPDTVTHPPQTGSNKEIGFKSEFFGGRLSGTLAFFQTELINKQYTVGRDDPSNITLAPGAPAGSLAPLAYATLGGLERYRGVELDFLYNVNKDLRFLGSYAYTEAGIIKDSATRTDATSPTGATPPVTVKRAEGQQASLVPKHQWRLWSNYKFPASDGFLKTASIGLGVRYYGPAIPGTDNYRNAVVLDATVVDLSLSRKIQIFNREISTTVRVQNLLDKRYYGTRQIYGDPRLFVLELRHYF
jgi:iron complex outermembrane receptor protein